MKFLKKLIAFILVLVIFSTNSGYSAYVYAQEPNAEMNQLMQETEATQETEVEQETETTQETEVEQETETTQETEVEQETETTQETEVEQESKESQVPEKFEVLFEIEGIGEITIYENNQCMIIDEKTKEEDLKFSFESGTKIKLEAVGKDDTYVDSIKIEVKDQEPIEEDVIDNSFVHETELSITNATTIRIAFKEMSPQLDPNREIPLWEIELGSDTPLNPRLYGSYALFALGGTGTNYGMYKVFARPTFITQLNSQYSTDDYSRIIQTGGQTYTSYCIQYMTPLHSGQTMTESNLSVNQKEYIGYALAYGWQQSGTSYDEAQYQNANNKTAYLVTQGIIWCCASNYFNTSTGEAIMDTIIANSLNPSYARSYYNTLKTNIINASKVPSFSTNNSASAPTITLEWNSSTNRYEAVVTDSNGVLGNFNYSYSGLNFSKSGNNLTIYTTNRYTDGVTASASRTVYGGPNAVVTWNASNYEQDCVTYRSYSNTINSYIRIVTKDTDGILNIKKSSSDPAVTNGNSCYSLQGAVYGVYTDQACKNSVGTLTTNASGESNAVTLKAGTYYVKETTAPKGYYLDIRTYTVKVNPGNTTTLSVTDRPEYDPVYILLKKFDSRTGETVAKGDGSLGDAQFTIKYYSYLNESETGKTTITDPAKLGKSPERTWVLKTDRDGAVNFGDATYKVAGNDFYYNSAGRVFIPRGTITIQETKAPVGYHINPEVFVRQVIPGKTEGVSTYNIPEIPEKDSSVTLTKVDLWTGTAIPGTKFRLTKPNGSTQDFVTDNSGQIYLPGLIQGNYKIQEIEATAGYERDDRIMQFKVAGSNNEVQFISSSSSGDNVTYNVSNGDGFITFRNKPKTYSLEINKYNNKDKRLDGAEFTVYSDSNRTKVVGTSTTVGGKLMISGLQPKVTYYVVETKAAKGYKPPVDASGKPIVHTIYAESTPVSNIFNFTVDGTAYNVNSTQGTVCLKGDVSDRIISISVTNAIMMKLPETGKHTMIPMMLIGMTLMCLAFSTNTKNKHKRRTKMKKSNLFKTLALALALTLSASQFISSPLSTYAANVGTSNGTAVAGSGTASITIAPNNVSQSLIGKQFEVFKLFNAENSVANESINYTFNNTYKQALQNIVGPKVGKTPSAVTEYEAIDYIQSLNHYVVEGAMTPQTLEGRYSEFRYFVEGLRSEMKKLGNAGDVITVNDIKNDGSFVISGLDYGYYIVDEISANQGTHSASSLCMVSTSNPVASIRVKSDYPSVTKKIMEDDNSIGWNDIGDYEIGQTVPYKFTSNVPDMNGYASYYYAWHDVMNDALTFDPASVSITISDNAQSYTLKAGEYKIQENVTVGGQTETFVVSINNLKQIVDLQFNNVDGLGHNTYGQTVTLEYNATLNDLAANDTGRPGFENDVRLEFSNDPDATGTGKTGYTPWDTVVCFTYMLNVLKTNDHDLALENAKFRLYSDENCTNEVYVKKTANGYNVINRDSVGGSDHTGGTQPLDAVEMVSDSNGNIVIYGLDGGTYYLMETKAPVGYRPILDPIRVQVVPVFTVNRDSYIKGSGASDDVLQSLDYNVKIVTFLEGVFTTDNKTLQTDINAGSGNLTVINVVGKKLPTTGSSMTIVMIGVGATCMLVALGLTKRKKTNENK